MTLTRNSTNGVYIVDISQLNHLNSSTWSVTYVSDNTTNTPESAFPKPGRSKEEIGRILEDWNRYNALDEQQKHMIRPPPSLDDVVADRLAGDDGEYWGGLVIHSVTWTAESDFGKELNIYNKLRHSATQRCFEAEMATRRAYAMRARSRAQMGRRRGGFKFSKAYTPKRSWMQGRPRR